jgi:hypothetical protein
LGNLLRSEKVRKDCEVSEVRQFAGSSQWSAVPKSQFDSQGKFFVALRNRVRGANPSTNDSNPPTDNKQIKYSIHA